MPRGVLFLPLAFIYFLLDGRKGGEGVSILFAKGRRTRRCEVRKARQTCTQQKEDENEIAT